MRQIFALILILLSVGTPTSTHADTALAQCLEKRLNAVLRGENIKKHVVIRSMVFLAIGKGNFLTIEKNEPAIERFEKLILQLMETQIAKKGKPYIGSTVTLTEKEPKKYTTAGYLTVPNALFPYTFGVSFNSRAECKIKDINIENAFKLFEWIREQPSFITLMDEYNMKK